MVVSGGKGNDLDNKRCFDVTTEARVQTTD